MNTQSQDYYDEKKFWPKARIKADQSLTLYFERLDEFAAANDMKRCRLRFAPGSLTEGRQYREWSKFGYEDFTSFRRHRAVDHVVGFQRQRKPIALLTEPYDLDASELDEFEDYVIGKGLVLHMAPVLMSSFHNAGRCACMLITKPDFGNVSWLPPEMVD